MHYFTEEDMCGYIKYLQKEEYGESTVKKYMRDICAFVRWTGRQIVTENKKTAVDKEMAVGWKAYLTEEGYAPVTVNAMLSALNGFLRFMGWEDRSDLPFQ